jgi:hypothetical protein
MAIRFEEDKKTPIRNIEVLDNSNGYIGEVSNHCGNDFYFSPEGGGDQITAKTLREIADKLDELNKEKK